MVEAVKRPFRFFGPVKPGRAEDLAERMIESDKFKQTLIEFLSGEIEPYELAYAVQIHAENEEEALEGKVAS